MPTTIDSLEPHHHRPTHHIQRFIHEETSGNHRDAGSVLGRPPASGKAAATTHGTDSSIGGREREIKRTGRPLTSRSVKLVALELEKGASQIETHFIQGKNWSV